MVSPKTRRNKSVMKNNIIHGREEAFKSIESYLTERGIKSERVLSYVCYTYKGKDYRAQTVYDVKKVMGHE